MASDYMSIKILNQLQKKNENFPYDWFKSVASYIIKIIYYLP